MTEMTFPFADDPQFYAVYKTGGLMGSATAFHGAVVVGKFYGPGALRRALDRCREVAREDFLSRSIEEQLATTHDIASSRAFRELTKGAHDLARNQRAVRRRNGRHQ